MPRGGARNRSGPAADPTSARSEARGLSAGRPLSVEGYKGQAPPFPLPLRSDPERPIAAREAEAWAEAWRSPQAIAWAEEPWRWPIVAEYVRLKVTAESSSNAPLFGQLHRYRDQLGLTPAGLRENGWQIVTTKDTGPAAGAARRTSSSRGRLHVVPSDE